VVVGAVVSVVDVGEVVGAVVVTGVLVGVIGDIRSFELDPPKISKMISTRMSVPSTP
jgi:predicted benzoate:H+ symporter BenE